MQIEPNQLNEGATLIFNVGGDVVVGTYVGEREHMGHKYSAFSYDKPGQGIVETGLNRWWKDRLAAVNPTLGEIAA